MALGEALAVVQRTGGREVGEMTHSWLAELEVLTGRPEEAIRRLEELAAADDVFLAVHRGIQSARPTIHSRAAVPVH
jgi:hypothetical protein